MNKAALVVSVLCGLASLGLGHLYLSRLEAEVSGGPKISVLVAAKDIPVAAVLKKSLVAVRDIPQAYLEERHVRAAELEKVLGTRVSAGLSANSAIFTSDLAQFRDERAILAGLVPQGMRAVPLDGNEVDFGGLLRPGDRVDVLLTMTEGGESSTRTLLQNLVVLSVGMAMKREQVSISFGRKSTVTVSVTVEGAQVLVQGRKKGKLSLTLRNNEDLSLVEGLPETTDETLTQDRHAFKTRSLRQGAQQ